MRHLVLGVLGVSLVAAPALAQEPPAPAAPAFDADRRQAIVPRPPVREAVPLFTVSGALRAGVQWVVDPPRARDDVFGFGALDVVVVARPTPNVTLLADVEGLGGPGPDQALGTLSRLHGEMDRLDGDGGRVLLREAWLRLQSGDGRVRFNIGKLDVAHYFDRNFFAEDETRQFMDGALLGNPLLKPPPNGPGAAIRVSRGDWRYAFGVQAPDDVGGDMSGLPYVVGELGHRNIFPLRGHYRWWTRVGSVADRRADVTWGTGVSIDQLVTADTGVFVRAGVGRSEGESVTSHAWSAGVQHTPVSLGRPRDLVGVAYAVQREAPGREHVAEVYYNLALTGWWSVVANVEAVVTGPNRVTGGRNRGVLVPGLRALLLF